MWLTFRARTVAFLGLLFLFISAYSMYYSAHVIFNAFHQEKSVPILIIDAGHGGFDGGAVGISGISEQDINLSIAQKTKALANFFAIETIMTRENNQALGYNPSDSIHDNKVTDIKMREQIANKVENGVFVSIHLNKFEDSQYSGAQTFYSGNNEQSSVLAKSLQNSLILGLNPQNNRLAKQASNDIYLMKQLTCPAVIVECGFLSNAQEEQLLADEEYHKKIAISIINGYNNYINSTS